MHAIPAKPYNLASTNGMVIFIYEFQNNLARMASSNTVSVHYEKASPCTNEPEHIISIGHPFYIQKLIRTSMDVRWTSNGRPN
ncbi:hypothetical protein NQ317_013707 [Molorchus minor]|uniref:Uncharacterized protein n=1 Tax=Molorchus minor TaxID=1323400 RepID=A0ABQ9IR65_9CUCU|nr:hypothetical protein NQ317_013707 [Molorchus minor]